MKKVIIFALSLQMQKLLRHNGFQNFVLKILKKDLRNSCLQSNRALVSWVTYGHPKTARSAAFLSYGTGTA